MALRLSLVLAACWPPLARAVQLAPAVAVQPAEQPAEQGAAAQADGGAAALANFLSDGGSICFEGARSVADASLALRKVAPYRSIFNASVLRPGVRCADLGYANFVGEDECYPGVALFQRPGSGGVQAYKAAGLAALGQYAAQYGLTGSHAEVMAFCTCHGASRLRAHAHQHCEDLESMKSSWVRARPDGAGLTCDQVRFESASRAVALLKSSAQLPAHLADQVHPVNCSRLGFPDLMKAKSEASVGHFLSIDGHACFEGEMQTAGNALALKKATPYGEVFNMSETAAGKCGDRGYNFHVGKDDCYAGMQVFTRSQYEMMAYKLHKHNRLSDYSKHYNLDYHRVELMVACSCHPKSHLREQRKADCPALGPMQLSWVRTLPVSGELACDQGPFEAMTRAVVLLKANQQVQNSPYEHLAPLNCSEHLKDQQAHHKSAYTKGSIL
mmetsp:Transcript_90474/g.256432  ORF Transcript_90474/g.256432 Transcript_90474/m.256432 type:complete len:443 (-) Transcript_90474:19-1347(-)